MAPLLWSLLSVDGLVKVSWVGEFASEFGLVELDLFSLDCNEMSSSEFWGVDGFGMALGSLSFNA